MGSTLNRIFLCIVAVIALGVFVSPEMPAVAADTGVKLNETLLDAVKKGEYFTVEHLLTQGADPNYKDHSGKSLVDYAAAQYPKDCLIYLLNAGADITFNGWLRAFMSDISMQNYYTHVSLSYKNSQHVTVYDKISYFGLNLPIIPNNSLLRLNAWRLEITQPDMSHATVFLYDKNNKRIAEYIFSKDNIWKLHGVTLHGTADSLPFFSRNWLENIFRGVRQCGPINSGLNYDSQTRQSTGQFMEKRGYSNPVIDNSDKPETDFATYTIHESFFGLPAVELSLPGVRFRYSVTVQASAEKLAKAVYEHTGERIPVKTAGMSRQFRNDTAYIVSKSDDISVFVCAGSDEPQPVNLFDEDSGF